MAPRLRTPEPADVVSTAPGRMTALGCLTVTLALVLGSTTEAVAQTPDPAPDRVWGGCVLSATAVTELQGSIIAGTESEGADVSFVVVYSLSNPNDGQAVGTDFTGPVICINPAAVGITAFEADGEAPPPLTEASQIPTDTDPGGATTVDLLAAEEAFILQYELNDGVNAGTIEKRFCHTVAGNSDCFIIFPFFEDEIGEIE